MKVRLLCNVAVSDSERLGAGSEPDLAPALAARLVQDGMAVEIEPPAPDPLGGAVQTMERKARGGRRPASKG
ncbi:MAG TPA: hypothetical protein VFU47_00050 [Armatimonadota bacterium]|nr:hypothetical protein [Armatimonadota bacterium]